MMAVPQWLIRKVGIPALAFKERLQTGVAFNPIAAEMKENPYPAYTRLREKDPVHRSGVVQGLVLTRHADALGLLRNPNFGVDRQNAVGTQAIPPEMAESPFFEVFQRSVLGLDPPDHTRLRSLATKAFTPRAVERMRPRISAIVDELLASALARGHIDIIADLAYPLPVIVIAEMLGVPASDRGRFKAWSDDLGEGLEPLLSQEQLRRANAAASALLEYFRAIIAERRGAPREDLLSALIAAEEAGDRMTEQELLSMCVLLLGAGNETTTNLIGNGILALLRNPDQLAKLRADPSLLDGAIEELLRYDSPVQMTSRIALRDTAIDGVPVKEGTMVVALLGAANRDPAVFAEPDRLDITRAPGRHLSFGQGIHYCLGAPLARVEGAIASEALLAHSANLRLAGTPRWRDTLVLRGLRTLPVAFTAVALAETPVAVAV
jgi:pimeloyl-[acyl-carrier protein] synthase